VITEKKTLSILELFLVWLTCGIAVVFLSFAYTKRINLPFKYLEYNEIIHIIEGSIFTFGSFLCLLKLEINLKLLLLNFISNIKYNFKIAFKYFLFIILAVLLFAIIFYLLTILLVKLDLFKIDKFNAYYNDVIIYKLSQKKYFSNFLLKSPIKLLLYLFATCVLIPIEEEIFSRLLLYVNLRKDFKPLFSIIISSLFFGIEHLSISFITPFLYSLYSSWIYEKHENLSINILLHSMFNLFVFIFTILRS